jgi:hypothetical protein
MASSRHHEAYLAKLQQIQDADAARLDAFRQADQDRRALFEEVLTKYKDLIVLHDDLTSDMNDLKLANRSLNYSIKGMSEELDALKHQQVCLHGFYLPRYTHQHPRHFTGVVLENQDPGICFSRHLCVNLRLRRALQVFMVHRRQPVTITQGSSSYSPDRVPSGVHLHVAPLLPGGAPVAAILSDLLTLL